MCGEAAVRHRALDQSCVDLIGQQLFRVMPGGVDLDRDGNVERLGKPVQDAGQEHVRNGDARADAQRGKKIKLSLAALKVLRKLHDARRLFIKRFSGAGEEDPAGDTVKQDAACFLLELGDHMGNGGLRHIQALCGAGKAHLFAYAAENGKLAQIHIVSFPIHYCLLMDFIK